MISKYKSFMILLILAAAIAAAAFYFLQTDRLRARFGPPEKITIACSKTVNAALPVIARSQGYFLKEGLEVAVRMHAYGKPALEDMLAGKADLATVAETPLMLEIMKGRRLSIIATIEMSGQSTAVIARRDRGIREISDLRRRVIAATPGTAADYFLDALLAAHGIARKEIRIVDMNADLITGALVRGEIDAASLFAPYTIMAQNKLGENGLIFHDKDIYTLTFNIAASQDFIRRNSEKIKKILRALIRAEQYIRIHKADSQKILSDFTGMDIAFVRDSWAGSDFRVTLDQCLLLALEDESHWAIKNKLTPAKEIPNYLDFIYFDGLQSVKPEALMILR